jgi:Aldo/keto reductase family
MSSRPTMEKAHIAAATVTEPDDPTPHPNGNSIVTSKCASIPTVVSILPIAPAQVALAYLPGKPAVTSLIVGARTSEQLAENLGAARIVLTAEERQRLDAITELPLLYPYWHQAKIASDRLSPADLTLLGRYLER